MQLPLCVCLFVYLDIFPLAYVALGAPVLTSTSRSRRSVLRVYANDLIPLSFSQDDFRIMLTKGLEILIEINARRWIFQLGDRILTCFLFVCAFPARVPLLGFSFLLCFVIYYNCCFLLLLLFLVA